MVKLVYGCSNLPASVGIRLLTFGLYSHCGIMVGDQVCHSTVRDGVHLTPLAEFLKAEPRTFFTEVKVPNEDALYTFLRAQMGKKYDWTALWSMLLRRDWQEDDSWFCSELLEAALAAGGKQRFRDNVHRITPHQSWSVL